MGRLSLNLTGSLMVVSVGWSQGQEAWGRPVPARISPSREVASGNMWRWVRAASWRVRQRRV